MPPVTLLIRFANVATELTDCELSYGRFIYPYKNI